MSCRWKREVSTGGADVGFRGLTQVIQAAHCVLDKVVHRSLCPPRSGTGFQLLEVKFVSVQPRELDSSLQLICSYKRLPTLSQFPSAAEETYRHLIHF